MKVSRFISRIAVSVAILVLLFGMLIILGVQVTPAVFALPAGFQEFYVPLPAELARGVFVNIDNKPAVSAGMHYVVGVTASADNTTVYYDHWENGYSTGAAGDEIVNLDKGQVHYFESSNIPTNPRGTGTFYDGGDRIFVAGSLLQLVVSIWPESPGTVFTDAWEVYPVQAWEKNYTIPVGEDLAGAPTNYRDFTYVYALVMSGTDGNNVQINDPVGGISNYTLDQGQTAIYEVKGAGTTVTATNPVEVQIMTGRYHRGSSSEMRGYTITPRSYWGTEYYAPVPSWRRFRGKSDLYLYNPNSFAITVNFEDRTGTGAFTIPAGGTKSYHDGAGRYVPVDSGVYLQSDHPFWGIAAGDTGSATWDWGYSLIPVDFLGTDDYVSWAPGSTNPTKTGSPTFVTALNDDTAVFVDYGPNDGVFDISYNLDRLEVVQIYDPDKNNTGMHLVSTAPVAVAWGESPSTAGKGNPYLDMGYTTLPLPTEWIEVALEVEKTANPTQVNIGGEAEFTVVISVPSTAGEGVTGIDLEDTLPPGWEYVTGSGDPSDPTSITGNLTNGYVLTWDADWTISPGSSQTVRFRAKATSSADTTNPNRNVAAATGQSAGAALTAYDDAFVEVEELGPPEIRARKRDSLFIDVNNDGIFNPGDTIKYSIEITNQGDSAGTGVFFIDDPDPNTSLLVGTVDVSECPGCSVTSGNDPGDTAVGVEIGDLAPGATVRIYFQVTIGTDGFTEVANQGTVLGTNFDPVLTDDPDTATPDDPTVTPVTIGPPELTITKFGPAEAVIDTTILYTGTLTNISDGTAYNVVLVDQLPEGVTFVGSSHTAVYDPVANTVTWDLGTVPPGISIPGWLTVRISPTVANGTVLTDTFRVTWEDKDGNDLGPKEAKAETIVYTHPQLALQKEGPAAALTEEIFNYKLTIRNIGGLAAQNVVLTDTLPISVTYQNSNPSGIYDAGPPEIVTWNLGSIEGGGSKIVVVTVKVNAGVANGTTITNTARVNWDDAEGPVEDTWETIIHTEPELVITKFGPAEAVVDSTITYTGTLTNIGGGIAKSVVLTDTLPAGVTFVSSSHAASYYPETNTVIWDLPDLPPGASIPGWLTVHIDPSLPDNTVLTDEFKVTWEDTVGNPLGPDTAFWDTTVHTNPLLTVTKDGPEQASPGDTINYTIRVENIGGTDALNTTLQDILPTGLTYQSSHPSGTHAGGVVTWNLGTIPAYGAVEVSLTARVDDDVENNTPVVDAASVTWQDSLGRDYGPDTAIHQTTIHTRPLLTIAKSGPATVYPDKTFTYTIKVCNVGGTAALTVALTDTLPISVTYQSSSPGGSYSNGVVTWALGAITPGDCVTVTLTVQVDAGVPNGTLLTNIADVYWSDADGNDYGPVSDVWETTVNTRPQLTIVKTGPAEARQGDKITYEIEVCNVGGTEAVTVTLHDQLPIGLTYSDSDPPGTHADGVVTWTLGTIDKDVCKTVPMTVTVDFGLPVGTVLIDAASVTWKDSQGADYGPATDTAGTEVNPALILDKDAQTDEGLPGETVRFTITYENIGTTTLTGVVVTEFYDPNVTFDSATPPPDDGTNNQWTIGELAPGASGNIEVVVRLARNLQSGAILRNDVKITSDQGAEAEDPKKTTVGEAPPSPPSPIPVGGLIVPVNKLGLLAPWMELVALASLAALTVALIRRRRD